MVGTHALIEPAVEFRDLARRAWSTSSTASACASARRSTPRRPSGLVPHALHMTATPIPRTLSLTAYGDLDATVLRELPAGRRPVETHVVDGARARARAYERIREEIARRAAVLRRLPARRGVRGAPGQGRHRRVRAPAHAPSSRDQRVELIHGQMPLEAEAGRDGGVRRAARPTCSWPPA